MGRKQRHKGQSQGRGGLMVHGDLRTCEELGEVMQTDGGGVQ
jgi:hypothetical protein